MSDELKVWRKALLPNPRLNKPPRPLVRLIRVER